MLYIFLCSRHEYISGYYGTAAYFISKLMADLIPVRTLPSIIFTCITYFMLGKYCLPCFCYQPLKKLTRLSLVYMHMYIRRFILARALHWHGTGYCACLQHAMLLQTHFLRFEHSGQNMQCVSSPLPLERGESQSLPYHTCLISSFSFIAVLTFSDSYEILFYTYQRKSVLFCFVFISTSCSLSYYQLTLSGEKSSG